MATATRFASTIRAVSNSAPNDRGNKGGEVAEFAQTLPPATLRQPTPAMSARRTTPESNFPLSALPEPQDYIAGYTRAQSLAQDLPRHHHHAHLQEHCHDQRGPANSRHLRRNIPGHAGNGGRENTR